MLVSRWSSTHTHTHTTSTYSNAHTHTHIETPTRGIVGEATNTGYLRFWSWLWKKHQLPSCVLSDRTPRPYKVTFAKQSSDLQRRVPCHCSSWNHSCVEFAYAFTWWLPLAIFSHPWVKPCWKPWKPEPFLSQVHLKSPCGLSSMQDLLLDVCSGSSCLGAFRQISWWLVLSCWICCFLYLYLLCQRNSLTVPWFHWHIWAFVACKVPLGCSSLFGTLMKISMAVFRWQPDELEYSRACGLVFPGLLWLWAMQDKLETIRKLTGRFFSSFTQGFLWEWILNRTCCSFGKIHI